MLMHPSALPRANTWRVLQAVAAASVPVDLAVITAGSLLAASGIVRAVAAADVCGWSLLLFILSMAAHKLVQAAWFWRAGAPVGVMRHGTQVRIVYDKDSRERAAPAAYAGPLAGAALCLLASGGMWLAGQPVLAFVAAAIGVLHGMSFSLGHDGPCQGTMQ